MCDDPKTPATPPSAISDLLASPDTEQIDLPAPLMRDLAVAADLS
jgi:hypothetical protein